MLSEIIRNIIRKIFDINISICELFKTLFDI